MIVSHTIVPLMRYADGEQRPRLRGVMHQVVAYVIPILAIPILISFPRWPIALFLFGKEASYASSAYLHRAWMTTISIPRQECATKVDYCAICISILSTGIPHALSHLALYYGVSCSLLLLSTLFTLTNWELPRLVATFAQLFFAISYIGYASRSSWNPIWIAGTVSYAAAFANFWPVAARRGVGKERVDATMICIPWHKPDRNGFHEDFHVMLLLADILYFVNAILYGYNDLV